MTYEEEEDVVKILVDSLPYYHDDCPFDRLGFYCADNKDCPMTWDKHFVCSDDNPRECEYLKEIDK